MSDRTSAFPSGAPACPFVALVDDRDRRAASPDPRHRCYAESPARSRPLSHQAAYCISSTFPRCPTFLAWAARAAADPLTMHGVPSVEEPSTPTAPSTPTDADRLWQTPPPWFLSPGAHPGSVPSGVAIPADAAGIAMRASALGSAVANPEPSQERRDPDGPQPVAVAVFDGLESPGASLPDPASSAIAVAPPPATVVAGAADEERGSTPAEPESEGGTPTPRAGRRFLRTTARDGGVPVPLDIDAPSRLMPQTRAAITSSGSGEWQGRRVSRPYPAVGSRLRIGLVPPAAIGFVTLVAVAIVIFLLPGFLSGGGPAPDATATPSVRGGVVTDPTPIPTPRPKRTPFQYAVRPNDNLIRIARRFRVSVNKIVCASGIKDPNLLSIGQVLTIPGDDFTCPRAGGGQNATPRPKPTAGRGATSAPGGSPAP